MLFDAVELMSNTSDAMLYFLVIMFGKKEYTLVDVKALACTDKGDDRIASTTLPWTLLTVTRGVCYEHQKSK